MKKKAFGVMLTLLFIGIFALAFNIQPVGASGTIYIRADGSIDPPTAPIHTVDNFTYTLTDNIYDSIVVQRNNVVIDGNRRTLQSPVLELGTGISLSGRENVTIKNTTIKNYEYGIWLNSSSTYNNISGNNITNNEYGILLYSSSNYNSISGNNITNNVYGITLWQSSNSTIMRNIVTNNDNHGVEIVFSSGNTLSENNVENTGGYGFLVFNSSFNTIDRNSIRSNGYFVDYPAGGIYMLVYSSLNTVTGNIITNNKKGSGVLLSTKSNNNTISENIITDNSYGISILYEKIWISEGGSVSGSGFFNIISGNSITNNQYGIGLSYSSNNSISGNDVANDRASIELVSSLDNKIFHNNFRGKAGQAHIDPSGYANWWDDGYPFGGNYWSDYFGNDTYRGLYQNETGSDGIGDTVYEINAINVDNHPLMGMFSDLNATLEYHVQAISNSTISDFKFNGSAISFNVSGENGTSGFCRLTIPHTLLSPPYNVTVNNNLVAYTSIFENDTLSIIYFNYTLSTKEVIIVPELPSFLILPLFMLATLLAVIFYKRRHSKRRELSSLISEKRR